MNEERWVALMLSIGFSPNLETYRALHDAYLENHRHYHTDAHIDHCLVLLDEYRGLAQQPDEVEIALWFHDAIYKPISGDNEAKSADWAARFLEENRAGKSRIDRVRAMIMATVHDAVANDPDTQLLVDIDLSILGSDSDTYRQFENNVRKEYKWVPGPFFKKGRRKILQSFLDRSSIFSTDLFRGRFEVAARSNLKSAIEAL